MADLTAEVVAAAMLSRYRNSSESAVAWLLGIAGNMLRMSRWRRGVQAGMVMGVGAGWAARACARPAVDGSGDGETMRKSASTIAGSNWEPALAFISARATSSGSALR